MTDTVPSIFSKAASSNPHGTAIITEDCSAFSYAFLSDEVERLASQLALLSVRHGDAVALVLPNSIRFMACFLAVTRAGAVAAPLNPAYTENEFRFYIEDSDCRLVILDSEAEEAKKAASSLGVDILEVSATDDSFIVLSRNGGQLSGSADPIPPAPDDIALLLHTSGTTSRPKGVPLSHRNIVASLLNVAKSYSLSVEDKSLIVMPLFHVHGLMGAALSTLSTGGAIVVPPRFSASRFWQLQQTTGATWYSASPTIHQVLLMRADDDEAPRSGFRFIRSCSAALTTETLKGLENRFDAPVLEAYGMTEAAHQMSTNPLPPGERRPGSVGTATGVKISIMDMESQGSILPPNTKGEIVIRGENVMGGYRNNPEATRDAIKDGWFRTGDQGFLSEDGYLTLTGRIKELINRGGEKISPLEIDEVLKQHPSVLEAVAFSVPDKKYGECVRAAVVLRESMTEEMLKIHCREKLADFKVPDVIYVTNSLPRTATGKIQRRTVAAGFAPSAGDG